MPVKHALTKQYLVCFQRRPWRSRLTEQRPAVPLYPVLAVHLLYTFVPPLRTAGCG